MKKKIIAAVFLASFAAGAAIAGVAPGTGVVGSAHDMNSITGLTDDAQGRVCAFCHTPHHALADPSNNDLQPLWSHEYTGYINNWIPYQSPTLQANIIDPLKGPSRLCMSCHDGVVAADQHYGSVGGNTNARLQSDTWNGAAIGKATNGSADFSNDHPIGFNYNDAQAADIGGGLFPSLNRTFKGNSNNPTLTVKDVLLDGDFMTCATCHDVHNKDNATNTKGGMNYFVYGDQNGSQLCLTCHAKGSESI